MANNYKEQELAAKQAIQNIIEQFKLLDAKMLDSASKLANFNTNLKGSSAQSAIQQQSEEVKKFNTNVNELNNTFKSQIPTLRQLSGLRKQENQEIERNNKLLADSKKEREAKISKDLTQSMIAQIKAIGQTNDGLRQLNSYYRELEISSKKVSTQLEREKIAREKAISKEMTGRMREHVNSIGKQSDAIKKLNLYYRDLEKSTAKEAANAEKAANAQKKLSGAYNQLVAKQQQAKKTLQDLVVSQGKNATATKKAQLEYNKYTRQVNLANRATSNFSKTGLGGLVRGFKNLLGAFGVIGGVMMFAEFAKSTIKIIKELDKLDFTLQKVTKNAGELARTKSFLTEISLKFGLEIVSLTERYTKFMVAARQSGLELKVVEGIFSTFAEAGAVLGLKTHELEGIFLALEQMLSKGKVTTEELRRQLGERLPGAFDLMAKALNVTTKELDRMLRAGEVLSSDAIPKLTEVMKEFFELNGDGVDTLQASTQKLSTSWTLFIDTLNDSTGAGNIWQGILDGLAWSIQGLSDSLLGLQAKTKRNAFAEYSKELADNFNPNAKETSLVLADLTKEMDGVSESIFNTRKQYNEAKRSFFGSTLGLPETVKALDLEEQLGSLEGKYEALYVFKQSLIDQSKDEAKQLINTILNYKDKNDIIDTSLDLVNLEKMNVEQLKDAYRGLQERVLENGKFTIPYYEDLIKKNEELRLTLKANNSEDIKKSKILDEQNKEYQKQIDLLKSRNKASGGDGVSRPKNQTSVVSIESQGDAGVSGGMIRIKQAVDQKIKSIKELLEYTPKWSKDYEVLTKKLESLKKAFEGIDVTKANEQIQKNIDKAKEDAEALQKLKDALKDFRDEFATEFFSEAGFEFTGEVLMNFDKVSAMIEAGGDKWEDYFNLITEMGQEAFNFIAQASQQNFDAEYERLEKQKAIALQFAGESDAAKQRIEEQSEARRKVIQARQAKAQKELAMTNIVIDTAQAIMATLGITGFAGIPLSVIVGAIGAAQLAVVASQKIPEFFRGTENAPQGLALVDEKQPEVHTDRQGRIKSFGSEGGANYRFLEQGDKIYKSRELYFEKEFKNVLNNNDILPYSEFMNMPSVVVQDKGIKAGEMDAIIGKHFSNIQTNQTVIDKNGLNTYVKKQNSKTTLLNNRVSFKGFSV